ESLQGLLRIVHLLTGRCHSKSFLSPGSSMLMAETQYRQSLVVALGTLEGSFEAAWFPPRALPFLHNHLVKEIVPSTTPTLTRWPRQRSILPGLPAKDRIVETEEQCPFRGGGASVPRDKGGSTEAPLPCQHPISTPVKKVSSELVVRRGR